MLSALARLFSSKAAADDVLDKDNGLLVRGGQWIDHLNYTEEEKAKMSYDLVKVGNERLMALQPFKVVQRILAFGVTFFWAFVGINCVGAIWYDHIFDAKVATDMVKFATSDYVFWPVVSVMSLYFLGGVVPRKAGES